MSSPYSSDKALWWAIRDGYPPKAPKQVHFIICDLCNEDCHFCAYRLSGYTSNELFVGGSDKAAYGHNNPKRWIPTERALSLLDEFKAAGVVGIQYTGGGEPTVHPDHLAIMQRSSELGFHNALVSNGLKWSHDLKVLAASFDWVRVSVDAGCAETYGSMRNTKPEHFNRVLNNMHDLSIIIRERKYPCALGMGYVVTERNWQEVYAGVAAAKDHGAHNVRISAYFNPQHSAPFEPFFDECRALIDKAREDMEDDTFTVFDRFGDRIEDLRQESPDYKTCHYQGYTTYVGGDQQVYRCCVNAYSTLGAIKGGDLSERRFDEFWSSEDRKSDFAAFDSRKCELCYFHKQNRGMEAALREPVHKEFP